MVIGGLWHGAGWTFVIWGAYQGILLVVHRMLAPVLAGIKAADGSMRPLLHAIAVIAMFQFTCYGWLLFRATSVAQIAKMTHALLLEPWIVDPAGLLPLLTFAAPLALVELLSLVPRRMPRFAHLQVPLELRVAGYSALAYLALFVAAPPQGFIYFKF